MDYTDDNYSDVHISEFLLFFIIASNENYIFTKRNKLIMARVMTSCTKRFGEIAGKAIFDQIVHNVDIDDFLNDYLRR